MSFLKKIYNNTKSYIDKKTKETGNQYKAYGIFGIINFPLYYLTWLYLSPQYYESLFLRVTCTLLCFLLALHEYWPKKLKKFLPIYWYFTLLFTLPYFFTYMLIMNHGAAMWVTNTIVIVFFVLLLVDWLSAIILLVSGSALGLLAATSITKVQFLTTFDYTGFLITYCVAIVIGVIFAHNKQVTEQILRRSIKAEANSRAKSEFIANMSHDLRTPISGIIGMVQDLINTADATDKKLKLQDSLNRDELLNTLTDLKDTLDQNGHFLMAATDELLQLCNEILEAVKLESGAAKERFEDFGLHELIKHNIELLQPVANHKKLKLSYKIDPNVPKYLYGLCIYLDRILLNIISNALKFTNDGYVNIKIHTFETKYSVGDSLTLKIDVEDSGIGIPKDKFDTIFNLFTRLSPTYEGLYKGAGLGLYSVKQYIDVMGGKINLNSRIGQGTCFSLELPFKVSDHADRTKFSIRKAKQIKDAENDSATMKTSLDKQCSDAFVLIVEDHALASVAVQLTLKTFNCAINVAERGEQAVTMALENNYDLILMDIGLPDISGIEATRKIRQLPNIERASVPIVALTGHAGDNKTYQESIDAGMQEVLNKPAQPHELEAILEDYVFKPKESNTLNEATTKINQKDNTPGTIIDWESCLKMYNGDSNFVNDLLSILAVNLKTTRTILEQSYIKQDINALKSEVHRTLGSICYLKVPHLEFSLKTFQDILKQKPIDFQNIEPSYETLKNSMSNFLGAWKNTNSSPNME